MTEGRCRQCGAKTSGLICDYCGALGTAAIDLETEARALGELHQLIQNGDKKRQTNLLKTGFLPESRHVLIDAGLRCMPIVDLDDTNSSVSNAALQRLEAIIAKLGLMPEDPETLRACQAFREKIEAFRKKDRSVGIIAVILVLALLALAAWPIVRCVGR